MPQVIQFKGLNDLPEIEREIARDLAEEYYDKIKMALKNLTSMTVHIKEYSKTGNRHKYSIHAKVIAPTHIFEGSYDDWDLPRVLHKVFKNLERQIQHKLRTDEQHD